MIPIFAHGLSNEHILIFLILVIGGPIAIAMVIKEVVTWVRDKEDSPFNGITLILLAAATGLALVLTPWIIHRLLN